MRRPSSPRSIARSGTRTGTCPNVGTGGGCGDEGGLAPSDIVARESYSAWMAFQAGLSALASDRCVITLPEAKELE